jgi:hypothetical protein
MGIIVDGKELAGPDNVTVKNFKTDPSVFHFKNQARPLHAVTEVVVHETVTVSWANTVAVLKARGLGVHFIADPDGTIYQHADLLTEEMWHASQHNGVSVGIEVVNPFEPQIAPKNGPWTGRLEKALWTRGVAPVNHVYVVPTIEQCESVCQLLNWLSSSEANPVTIPQQWQGIETKDGKTTLALGRVAKTNTPNTPGILAHMYFNHGDGAWLILYAWLRLEAGYDAPMAYAEAQKRAQSTMNVDLTDIVSQDIYNCHSH